MDVLAFGLANGSLVFGRASDLAPGNPLLIRHGHTGRINSVSVAPKTNSFLTGGNDGTARLFPPIRYCQAKDFDKGGPVSRIDWQSHFLASASQQRVRMIDVNTDDAVFDHRQTDVHEVRIAPATGLIATIHTDRENSEQSEILEVRKIDDKSLLWTTKLPIRSHRLAIDRQGKQISLQETSGVVIRDLSTGEVKHRLPHPAEPVESEFCSTDQRLISIAQDGIIRVWNSESGTLIRQHQAGRTACHLLSVATDDQSMAVLSDGNITVLDLSTWTKIAEIPTRENLRELILLESGESIAVLFESGLSIWRVLDGSEVLDFRDDHPVDAMARSPDGDQIATQKSQIINVLDGRRMPDR